MTTFQFKKKFGQNFLRDKVTLTKIVEVSGVTKEDTVVEIGAGKGALTEVLMQGAKRVIAFEIDPDLKEFLSEKFASTNVELVFEDIMDYDDKKLGALLGGKFKLVANLPYYLTSPLVTRFLQNEDLESMTVMVQEEVADRLVARPKTKSYGVLTVIAGVYGVPSKVFRVNKEKFYPMPKVDSAVVKIERLDKPPKDAREFIKFVKKAFSMRRKKLSACLASENFGKQDIERLLEDLGFGASVRAEELDISKLMQLYEIFGDKM